MHLASFNIGSRAQCLDVAFNQLMAFVRLEMRVIKTALGRVKMHIGKHIGNSRNGSVLMWQAGVLELDLRHTSSPRLTRAGASALRLSHGLRAGF